VEAASAQTTWRKTSEDQNTIKKILKIELLIRINFWLGELKIYSLNIRQKMVVRHLFSYTL